MNKPFIEINHGKSDSLEEMQKRGEIDLGGKIMNGKLITRGYGEAESDIIKRFKESRK